MNYSANNYFILSIGTYKASNNLGGSAFTFDKGKNTINSSYSWNLAERSHEFLVYYR